MEWRDPDAPVDLSPVGSETIRRVIERAIEDGNRVASLSQWTRALVAHMEQGLSEGHKTDIRAQYPARMVDTIYGFMKEDASAPVAVICRSGMRSGRAAKLLAGAGFTDVSNVRGGMMAWTAANLPVKQYRK